MYSKYTKINKLDNYFFDIYSGKKECKISKASIEIMLDRFFNGKGIDFPFHNN